MKKNKVETKKEEFDFRTIKSYSDGCKRTNLPELTEDDFAAVPEPLRRYMHNIYILIVLFQAINDGWVPDFSNQNEVRYYPWPWLSSSGFDFSASYCNFAGTNATCGSRLCTNKPEKAIYMLEQFPQYEKEFLLLNK